MPVKKPDEITVKLTEQQKTRLVGLSELKGITMSEAVRTMIERFISEHEREFLSMKSIFEDDQ